jgi:hypothetical protein
MSEASLWSPVTDELAFWQEGGIKAQLWLRDDDAIEPGAALERLVGMAKAEGAAILLATIPATAQPELARWLETRDHVLPCQHGFAHVNHALPGERAQEIDGSRPLATVLGDLAKGRERMNLLFGARHVPVLVPPWNRIAPAIPPHLPALGFQALSTFGFGEGPGAPGLCIANAHLDIIDWRRTRRGEEHPKLAAKLAEALRQARLNEATFGSAHPVGILTHHLVHGPLAWSFLENLFEFVASHPQVEWVGREALASTLTGVNKISPSCGSPRANDSVV